MKKSLKSIFPWKSIESFILNQKKGEFISAGKYIY